MVHVAHAVQQLLQYLDDLFFLEVGETGFQGEEGILGVLQEQMHIRLICTDMIQFHYVQVIKERQSFDLIQELFFVFPRVCLDYGFLSIEGISCLFLDEIYEGVGAYADGSNTVELVWVHGGEWREDGGVEMLECLGLLELALSDECLEFGGIVRLGGGFVAARLFATLTVLHYSDYTHLDSCLSPLYSLYTYFLMNDPFNPDISVIVGPDSISSSRCTDAPLDFLHEHFREKISFAEGILGLWGLRIGEMNPSRQNSLTLNCLLDLINWRQKDVSYRAKVKEDIGLVQFEKEKYRSLLEQTKRALEEKNKSLGRIENELHELKEGARKQEQAFKKERDDEKKVLIALKNKSEIALVQIKKKEQEVIRIKEQLKKSIGEKSGTTKNTFEVMGQFEQKDNPSKDRNALLLQKTEQEMVGLRRENGLLRDKLFEIREQLLQFAKWTDRQVFNEHEGLEEEAISRKYRNALAINHNLLFRKECLVEEFRRMLGELRQGIRSLQKECQRTDRQQLDPKSNKSGNKKLNIYQSNQMERNNETERRAVHSPRSTNLIKSSKPTVNIKLNLSPVRPAKSRLQFDSELLSDCLIKSEESIISFIDPEQILKGSLFDKMGDILFADEGPRRK